MPEFVHYEVTQKLPAWGRALTKGFGAQVARLDRPALLGQGYTHIVAGLQFGALEILEAVRAAGEPYVFADRAYFGGGHESGRMRVTLNAYQKNWVARHEAMPKSVTARRWGVQLSPWRKSGSFVLVVPPSPQVEQLFGIDWTGFASHIRAVTGREVRVSPKADRNKSPLAQRLRDCHCVITWSSNVAVEAIVAGIPAYVSEVSAAAPVARTLGNALRDIEEPRMTDRSAWVDSLAWGQFTLNEIASGFAREVVMEPACIPA